ncbi:MAG: cobyric acid synthase [Paracoccaceae bacterium]
MGDSLMIQGTGSNVGKSMLVAGLCRAMKRRGLRVLPFKPQNMSNNAAVTEDGGEIGRAQALQALACGVAPRVDMNPVLLKPESEVGSQVIVQGKRLTTVAAREYAALKPKLMTAVLESFERLKSECDIVLVEGAGSPAEINLRTGDIANMGFAEAARVPVILAGDIDRGGVIAQLVGSHAVLPDADRALIKGFLVNKFRGDPSLFDDGLREIENRTGWHNFGVAPWFTTANRLPAEDALDIRSAGDGPIKIAVPMLSRIANFDDLDPLKLEPSVTLIMVKPGEALPGDAALIILPGTKSTIGDLKYLREQGWDIDLQAHIRRGGRVLGICGGYQMLGNSIDDAEGIEGSTGRFDGLGVLNVETVMTPEKRLARVTGTDIASGTNISGYEIHIGHTDGPDCLSPVLKINGMDAGASSASGLITGCYIHGLFASDSFRAAFLETLGAPRSNTTYSAEIENTLDALADHLEKYLGIDAMLTLAKSGV